MGVIIISLTVVLQFGYDNLVFSKAFDLLSIKTGNETLSRSLLVFHEGIDETVDASENVPKPPNFDDIPISYEVRMCYQEVLVDDLVV